MLKLTNISKTFNPGTEDAKLALDNVSLHVRPGDFISIIGANGAGKSTLFGAIVNYYCDRHAYAFFIGGICFLAAL